MARFLFLAGVFLALGLGQVKRDWLEMVNAPAYVSDEAILSQEAARYPEPLFIDGDFVPAAVYYSGKKVVQVHGEEVNSFKTKTEPFLLITYESRFSETDLKRNKTELIKKDRDKVLLRKS